MINLTENKQMTRFPTIRFWIKNINEGIYDEAENVFHTIFGKVKRVSIIATIIDKREINLANQSDSSFAIDGYSSNFELDDGTGILSCVKWNMPLEEYESTKIGDLVFIVGLLKNRFGSSTLTIEIMKKIKDPNDLLLHDALIIQRIKSGDLVTLPSKEQDFDEIEFETEKINNEEVSNAEDGLKAEILSMIQKNSEKSRGTHLNDLKIDLQITEKKLKGFIRDLEYEGKIFLSDENTYLSWD
jgi:hypothetical protein